MNGKGVNTNGARPKTGKASITQPQIQMIPLNKIKQFRWSTGIRDKEKFELLWNNIAQNGMNNPPKVRPLGDGFYEPFIGDHRVMIAKKRKQKEIPCIVEDIDVDTALEICLSDNLCRADLSSEELEDKVTELWNSDRYKSRAELGHKIGLTGERIGQLISAKKLREKSKGTLDGVSTESINYTKPLEKDEDRIALLMLLKNGTIKASELQAKSKMLSKLPEQDREEILYHGKSFDNITQNAIQELPVTQKMKAVKMPAQNKDLPKNTYTFLKGLGTYIATITDEKQRKQAIDYVKFSSALLLRILKNEKVLHEPTYVTFIREALQIDAGIIDNFDGTNTAGVEWYF